MPSAFSRAHLVGLLVALPAIAGACAVGVLEGALLRATPPRVGEAPAGSFSEALREGDLNSVFLFIRSGRDPNTPIAFRDATLTGDREVMLSPMLIAVAANKDDAVMMLMSFGASLDAPANKFAACLADRLGRDGIAELIAEYGGPAAGPNVCPDTAVDSSAPLIAFGSASP